MAAIELEDAADDAGSTGSPGAAARSRSTDDAEEDEEVELTDEDGRSADVSKAIWRSRKCARSGCALHERWMDGGCPTTYPRNDPTTNQPSATNTGLLGTFQACAMCVFISYYYTTKLLIYQ